RPDLRRVARRVHDVVGGDPAVPAPPAGHPTRVLLRRPSRGAGRDRGERTRGTRGCRGPRPSRLTCGLARRKVRMDFAFSEKVQDYRRRLTEFMEELVYPAEPVYRRQMAEAGDPHHHPQIIEDLKGEARSRGLWNLFLPDVSGLRSEERRVGKEGSARWAGHHR